MVVRVKQNILNYGNGRVSATNANVLIEHNSPERLNQGQSDENRSKNRKTYISAGFESTNFFIRELSEWIAAVTIIANMDNTVKRLWKIKRLFTAKKHS